MKAEFIRNLMRALCTADKGRRSRASASCG